MAVWSIKSPTDITLRMTLTGHEEAVWALDLSETRIISGSRDKTIKVEFYVCCTTGNIEHTPKYMIVVYNLTIYSRFPRTHHAHTIHC